MSSYRPDPAALPSNASFVTLLSLRDLSLNVPINFVTYSGVQLTAACFSNGQYEADAAQKCISNLLVLGFRRIGVDVYWDMTRNDWSMCPVQLGGNGGAATSSSLNATTTPTASLSSGSLNGRDVLETAVGLVPSAVANFLEKKQDSAALQASTTLPESSAGRTATVSSHETPAAISSPAIQVGPYTCDPTVDLMLLTDVIDGHVTSTENNLNSTTFVLTLNIHAAAPASDPTGSAQQPPPDGFPQNTSLLSAVMSSVMSEYLYTPSNLVSARANINASSSFFGNYADSQPNTAYFQVNEDNNHFSTPDGWPSEGFIELQLGKRMLIGYGEVDPQMAYYNFSGDASTIFPRGYLQSPTLVTTSSNGSVTKGCIFDPAASSVQQQNSSWAISSLGSGESLAQTDFSTTFNEVQSLVTCGISPILNETLNGTTADINLIPYREYIRSSVWSWALGEPVNASSSANLTDYRCAALNSISGFWQAAPCSEARYCACRVSDQPFDWQISTSAAPYGRVNLACNENTTFDAPRSALENSHLLSVWRDYERTHDDDAGTLLWVDFNDLDVSECWVVGSNSTCPYQKSDGTATREVVVPVVAAVIVFCLAALTLLVKCAGNRRNTKRKRRRGADGWDYEGVPQ